MEKYKETIMAAGKEAYRDIEADLQGFLESRGLTSFGAGVSGVGMDSKTLAREILKFIYIENAKADLEALQDEERF